MTEEIPEGICGITKTTEHFEWICIREPHDKEYKRKKTDKSHQGYTSGTGAHPERGRTAPYTWHHFVNRWPNRKE